MPHKDTSEYNAYMRDYMTRRYHQRMAAAKQMLGGRCVECGTTDRLEFDHVDPSTKAFSIGKMWSLSDKKLQVELAKCQLLCHDCHRTKTYGSTVRRISGRKTVG